VKEKKKRFLKMKIFWRGFSVDSSQETVPKKTEFLGLLRCRGRSAYADLDVHMKFSSRVLLGRLLLPEMQQFVTHTNATSLLRVVCPQTTPDSLRNSVSE
jgi:hypothetical protein